jgi:cytochrome c nitrite reductase small subunit
VALPLLYPAPTITTSCSEGVVRVTKRFPLALGVICAAALGLAIGVGGFTFVYARGASYMTNDPTACLNCHAMSGNHSSWIASSHHAVATCNDCHAPHDVLGKYLTKASNGFRHALAFTTGRFPDSIQERASNRAVTNGACQACHERMTEVITSRHQGASGFDCLRCHGSVGHAG